MLFEMKLCNLVLKLLKEKMQNCSMGKLKNHHCDVNKVRKRKRKQSIVDD